MDSYKNYITDRVDLKIDTRISVSSYVEVAEFLRECSLNTMFYLHMSNDSFDSNGTMFQIDDSFERYLFEILDTFYVGQDFIFEFEYKVNSITDIRKDFAEKIKNYIEGNDNIKIGRLFLGEDNMPGNTYICYDKAIGTTIVERTPKKT